MSPASAFPAGVATDKVYATFAASVVGITRAHRWCRHHQHIPSFTACNLAALSSSPSNIGRLPTMTRLVISAGSKSISPSVVSHFPLSYVRRISPRQPAFARFTGGKQVKRARASTLRARGAGYAQIASLPLRRQRAFFNHGHGVSGVASG